MALNTRFATGIHALVLLAAEPDKLHTSEDVARGLKTNPVVVRRVFAQLHKAGLIKSHKGPNGGSKLAQPAKEITLRDIYRAVHSESRLPAPSIPSFPGLQATLKSIFSDASRAFEKDLDETTLAQIVKRAAKKAKH
jgi:Rrf2 family protein